MRQFVRKQIENWDSQYDYKRYHYSISALNMDPTHKKTSYAMAKFLPLDGAWTILRSD